MICFHEENLSDWEMSAWMVNLTDNKQEKRRLKNSLALYHCEPLVVVQAAILYSTCTEKIKKKEEDIQAQVVLSLEWMRWWMSELQQSFINHSCFAHLCYGDRKFKTGWFWGTETYFLVLETERSNIKVPAGSTSSCKMVVLLHILEKIETPV